MAATQFSKDISRFALMSKKECLEDLLSGFSEDTDGYKTVQNKIADVDKELVALEKTKGGKRRGGGGGSDKPKKLNGYNKFVKEKMSDIVKDNPDMDNRARMKAVSEMWRNMSVEAKAGYLRDRDN